MENITDMYLMGKEIGSGRYGVVRLIAKKSFENKTFAVKSIARESVKTDLMLIKREFDIMGEMDHPNILKY